MRLNKLTLRGLTRFTDTVEIPFSDIPAGLVAIQGANGEGKTTIMEAIPAALFRSLPSREGALPNHCQGRDAFVELAFNFGGSSYRSLVKVDAQAGTQEAHLFNGDGNTALVSGKVKEYDAMIAERITAQSIFLASVFASQNRKGNFLELSKSDRKDLMIRMLGLEKLQKISDAAGERAKVLDQEMAILRAKISDLEAKLAGAPALETDLAINREDLSKKTGQLESLRTELQKLIQEEATVKAKMETASGISKQIADLQGEIAKIKAQDKDIEERLANNRKILDQSEQIRGAAEILESLKERLVEAEGKLRKAETIREALATRKDEARALLDGAATCDRKLAELKLEAQAGRSKELANKDAEAREAERDVSACRQTISTEEAKLAGVKSEIKRMQEQSRILGDIPCGDGYPSCTLIASAITARDTIADKEKQLGEWAESIELARSTLLKDQGRLTTLQEEREAIVSTSIDETADEIRVRTKAEQYRKDASEHTPTPEEEATNRGAITLARATIEEHKAAIETTRKLADFLPKLEAAEKRIAELEAEVERNLAERGEKIGKIDLLQQDLANLPNDLILAKVEKTRDDAWWVVKHAESAILDIQSKTAATRARLEDLQKLVPQKDEQQALIDGQLRHLSHWRHLQKAYGRDGIQALEIDSAGPEVSSLINELLCSCFGTRFTLSFETTQAKKDGKGEKEVFDIRILDNERGREGKLESLSGGEKVILNEAISLALAIYNTHKSGKRWETLFRDETAGALDPQNADRYLRMLRRALELGGFHQLIFIAHQQELWEAADARIFVRDGKAEVA